MGLAEAISGHLRSAQFRSNWHMDWPLAATGADRSATARGRLHDAATSLLIERLGRQVDAVRPRDRASLGVNTNLGEVRGVAKRLEHPAPFALGEVHLPE